MELRYALRTLRRSPWYSTTVVAVLAIAIALATTVFAVVDGVLFKPLPYALTEELFLVRADVSAGRDPLTTAQDQLPPVSSIEIGAWREATPELTLTAVSVPYRFKSANGREYWAAAVDDHFLGMIGARPVLGGFTAADYEQPSDPRVRIQPILVSYRYWQHVLGGDPTAIGRTVDAWEREGTRWGERIAGVLPPDFVFPLDPEQPQPEMLIPIQKGTGASFFAIIRVPSSANLTSVRERLLTATQRAARVEAPHHNPRPSFDSVKLVAVRDQLARHERPAFALVFSGTAVLLLLACLNVAGLAAARNVERRRDLAIRRTLGAGTAVILRGLALEIGLLSVAAAALGILLARPLLLWTVALLPETVTLLKVPAIDGRVLASVAGITIGTVTLVALWPARIAMRFSGQASLGSLSAAATPPGRRSNFALISAQVALGFVLLTVGVLTTASLAAAWLTDAGFRRDRMILAEAYIRNYTSGADATRQLEEIDDLLSRIPGVERIATSSIQPLFGSSTNRHFTGLLPEGWQGSPPLLSLRRVSNTFFDVMDIRLIDGRWPLPGEWSADRPVAIVSETAARKLWPDGGAIGRTLAADNPRRRANEPSRTVIGVVADSRYVALDRDPVGDIYVPDRFDPGRTGVFFHLRTSGPASAVVPHVAQALRSRQVFANQVATHDDALFASVRHRALPAWLFGGLGTAALVLAGTGILGLLAMSAAQRTREMGIRIALGATSARVIALLFREQLTAVSFGLVVGGAVGLWAVRLTESQLYRVRPYDPVVWIGVAVSLVMVAGVGTLVPSLRAARVNPVEVLRSE